MTFVIICLDGFKNSYLDKAPFLKQLAKNNLNGEIFHGVGYASEYSAITGKKPEELGIIANFVYNPRNNFYFFLNFLENFPIRKQIRTLLDIVLNIKEFLMGNKQPKSSFDIPFEYLRYFDYSVKKNIFQENAFKFPTIFELLRHKKISAYMWPFIYKNKRTKIDLLNVSINTAYTDKRAFQKSIELLKENPDICYIHFFATDNLVHKYGIESKKTTELINELDYYTREISKYADKILIYSDHGMTDVKEIIDIKSLMNKTRLIYGIDYIMFLDDTLARFWILNKKCKNKIEKLLKETGKGKIILFKNKKIHKKFGEIIFLANSGVLICPNFYQSTPHKATHGYDDTESHDERGFYLFCKKQNKKGHKNIKMEDIFKIIMEEAK